MELTKKVVTKWLNNKIKGYNLLREDVLIPEVNEDYKYSPSIGKALDVGSEKKLHLDANAVRLVAKVMDYPIDLEIKDDDKEYPYRLSFRYKGFKFFCLESEEDYKERGAVV